MISTVVAVAAVIAASACSARPAASVSDTAAVRNAVSTTAADSSAGRVRRGLLREFLTVNDRGYFYTAYLPEARSAVKRFHFKATGRTFGYVDAAQQRGTVPLYRLHLVGRQSYLVTADKQEKNSLLASGNFTLDGVLGYIPLKAAAGRIPVWRLDHGPRPFWRLATTLQMRRLRRHGWHLDGLIGFMFRKS